MTAEFMANEQAMDGFKEQAAKFAGNYEQFLQTREVKRSDVPVWMTLTYCIWDIMRRDFQTAQAQVNPLDQADILSSGMDDPDFEDRSASYREILKTYIWREGNTTRRQRSTFGNLCQSIINRVMEESDILLITCNNAGADVTKRFNPTVIVCDEAGQSTMAPLAIPCISGPAGKRCFLLVVRTSLSRPCLVLKHVKNPSMSLLDAKQYPKHLLDIQYRMTLAIALWASLYFYDGRLVNDPSVCTDNPNRVAMCEVSAIY